MMDNMATILADTCKKAADDLMQKVPNVGFTMFEEEYIRDALLAGVYQYIYERYMYERRTELPTILGESLGMALGKCVCDGETFSSIQDMLDRVRFDFVSTELPLVAVQLRNPRMSRLNVAIEVCAICISQALNRLLVQGCGILGLKFEPRMLDATGFPEDLKSAFRAAYAKFSNGFI